MSVSPAKEITGCSARHLIWTEHAPPLRAGTPILLGRLLRQLTPGSFSVATARQASEVDSVAWPVAATFWIPASGGRTPIVRLVRSLAQLALVPWWVLRGTLIMRRGGFDAITAVSSGSPYFLVAGVVARLSAKPLAVYVLDDVTVSIRSAPVSTRVFARLLYPRLLRRATKLMVLSEPLRVLMRERGLKATVLPNPVRVQNTSPLRMRTPRRPTIVTFSGAVYSVQIDPLVALIHVAAKQTTEVTVRIFGDALALRTDARVRQLELTNVIFGEFDETEAQRVLGDADILYLPLSFDERHRGIVELAFPAKAVDYLASGTPILVHAPSWSCIARHFKEHELGIVVDTMEQAPLEAAINRLAHNSRLRETLVTRALDYVARVHDEERVGRQFAAELAVLVPAVTRERADIP